MTTTKACIASISLLFSSCIYTMDIIEHQPSRTQKKALTALMIKGCLQAPESLKNRNPLLLHHEGDFHLIQEGKHVKIPYENISGFKQKLTPEQFQGFLENGGYLWLSKNDQDDYFVEAKLRGFGGGVSGGYWGVVAGQFVGNVIVYGGISIVSGAVGAVVTFTAGPIAGGLAAQTIFHSLEATVVPSAQPFIHAMAIAGGIGVAVATGPV